jgi:hypothetical protein
MDIVAHAYNPSYWGGRGRRMEVKVSLNKKSMRLYLKNKNSSF